MKNKKILLALTMMLIATPLINTCAMDSEDQMDFSTNSNNQKDNNGDSEEDKLEKEIDSLYEKIESLQKDFFNIYFQEKDPEKFYYFKNQPIPTLEKYKLEEEKLINESLETIKNIKNKIQRLSKNNKKNNNLEYKTKTFEVFIELKNEQIYKTKLENAYSKIIPKNKNTNIEEKHLDEFLKCNKLYHDHIKRINILYKNYKQNIEPNYQQNPYKKKIENIHTNIRIKLENKDYMIENVKKILQEHNKILAKIEEEKKLIEKYNENIQKRSYETNANNNKELEIHKNQLKNEIKEINNRYTEIENICKTIITEKNRMELIKMKNEYLCIGIIITLIRRNSVLEYINQHKDECRELKNLVLKQLKQTKEDLQNIKTIMEKVNTLSKNSKDEINKRYFGKINYEMSKVQNNYNKINNNINNNFNNYIENIFKKREELDIPELEKEKEKLKDFYSKNHSQVKKNNKTVAHSTKIEAFKSKDLSKLLEYIIYRKKIENNIKILLILNEKGQDTNHFEYLNQLKKEETKTCEFIKNIMKITKNYMLTLQKFEERNDSLIKNGKQKCYFYIQEIKEEMNKLYKYKNSIENKEIYWPNCEIVKPIKDKLAKEL